MSPPGRPPAEFRRVRRDVTRVRHGAHPPWVPWSPRQTRRHTQQGAALLLAMLILTLVATLASAMVWQQWRAAQVETAERGRTQSAWILVGALDWARLILREDKPGFDHLGEPWAVPLAEARLSSFLAASTEGAPTDDGPEAFLSGTITDSQARYNLTNLVAAGQAVPTEVAVLKRLFDHIGVAPDLATTLAVGLRDAGGGTAGDPAPAAAASAASSASAPALAPISVPVAANPPLLPRSLQQLRWFGIDDDALARMSPYVTLLPRGTRVNLNTAPREVIAATIDGLDLAGAERLVQARERTPFENLADATKVLGTAYPLDDKRVGVATDYFEVRGRVRLGDRVLEERSLVWRDQRNVVTLSRERVNSQESLR